MRKPGSGTSKGVVITHVGANPDDHSTLDADALVTVIEQGREGGYRFLSFSALLTPPSAMTIA